MQSLHGDKCVCVGVSPCQGMFERKTGNVDEHKQYFCRDLEVNRPITAGYTCQHFLSTSCATDSKKTQNRVRSAYVDISCISVTVVSERREERERERG